MLGHNSENPDKNINGKLRLIKISIMMFRDPTNSSFTRKQQIIVGLIINQKRNSKASEFSTSFQSVKE